MSTEHKSQTIKKICYENSVACQVFSQDASRIKIQPKAVFIPNKIEELKEILDYCKLKNYKVTPRCSGTNLVGNAIGEVIVSFTKLTGVISVNKNEKYAIVLPGTIIDELNKEMEKYNLFFPVIPSSSRIATIAGAISCNAAGHKAIRYGKTNNWIDEVEVMDSEGNIHRLKNYYGLEGQAGFILKAKIRLKEREHYKLEVHFFDDVEEMILFIKKQSLLPNIASIEYISKTCFSVLNIDFNHHVILIEKTIDKYDPSSNSEQGYENYLWQFRLNLYAMIANKGYAIIEDPEILIEKLPNIINFLEKHKIPCFGHIGSGILHPCFPTNKTELIKNMFDELDIKRITGEHGFGRRKPYSEKEKQRILKFKELLDKSNIFQTLFSS